jgi:hypothetical protein
MAGGCSSGRSVGRRSCAGLDRRRARARRRGLVRHRRAVGPDHLDPVVLGLPFFPEGPHHGRSAVAHGDPA